MSLFLCGIFFIDVLGWDFGLRIDLNSTLSNSNQHLWKKLLEYKFEIIIINFVCYKFYNNNFLLLHIKDVHSKNKEIVIVEFFLVILSLFFQLKKKECH